MMYVTFAGAGNRAFYLLTAFTPGPCPADLPSFRMASQIGRALELALRSAEDRLGTVSTHSIIDTTSRALPGYARPAAPTSKHLGCVEQYVI